MFYCNMSNDSFTENWPRRLKAERLRLRLTQADLARHVNVSGSTQVAYEQGVRTPSLGYFVALKGIGIDVWYLMFGVRAERRAADTFDWALLAEVQEAITEWCSARELELPPPRFLEVSRLLYEQFISEREVQPDAIERILKLVA